MTDERNIAHDKTVALDKKHQGQDVVENSAIVPQPGKKPPLIDADTGPSTASRTRCTGTASEPRAHSDVSEQGRDEKWSLTSAESGDPEMPDPAAWAQVLIQATANAQSNSG